jgi:5,10-methylenetetrahydromethanopterin reductase
MGIQRVKPAIAIKEAILLVRGLLAGETVDFEGEVIQFRNGRLNFDARSDIPIYVASRGDLVLQSAGEVADGVMVATYAEPEGIRHALNMVNTGAARVGRSLDELTIISRVDACISEDRRAAIDAVKPMVGVFLWTSYPDRRFVERVGLEVPDELEVIIAKRDYNLMAPNAHLIPDEFVDKFCWAGTAKDVADQVARVVDMGIERITFLPHRPRGGGTLETINAFAAEVKPMVEAALRG